MIQRFVTALVVVGSILVAACIDMSAPKGPASISVLQLPSPSLVAGDTMRDSLGVVAPLHIIAFDADGNQIGDVSAEFFITDSVRVAHLAANNVLVGDKTGIVHLIGQIGNLQTPAVTVPVTVAPTAIASAVANVDTLRVPFTGDSATSIASSALSVTLHGANDSTAQGFVVKYVIASAPLTKAGSKSPAVYLADDNGHIASADTSDATGASRKLAVNAIFLADDALVAGTKTDSAIVTASAFYRGALVAGSPVRFVVPIRVTVTVK